MATATTMAATAVRADADDTTDTAATAMLLASDNHVSAADAGDEQQQPTNNDDDDDMDAQIDESCSEKRFFDEREQVMQLLAELLATELPSDESDVDAAFELKLKTILTILDRYLEQSHLLDPFLRELLDPIMAFVKRVIATVAADRAAAAAAADTGAVAFPFQVYHNPKLHCVLQVVYQLCKVRGYKTIVKLLPHEVRDFEPTLLLLQSQDRADHSTWTTRYVLLLWLSMLCLVPFDLNTIDSSVTAVTAPAPRAASAGAGAAATNLSIVASILTLCKEYLSDPGATQLAASVCLARLLSRPDMETHHLDRFLDWANTELSTATTVTPDRMNAFRVTGVMRCLAHIAKHAPRAQHVQASRVYLPTVLALIARMAADDAQAEFVSSSTLHRKLSVKLVQRLGLLYLPPRVQAWRYQRGLRSLEMNMQALGLLPEGSVAAAAGPVTSSGDSPDNDDDTDDRAVVFASIDALEQIVEVLLCGLRDKDTVVRWSAAKGIGRLTGRLPYEFADDIVQSVLELFVATESDGAWHGASLALAELARRGVLLPSRLPDAAHCVARALQYDVRRGAHSIGAHVRDAACYACWSFARAYDAAVLRPWLEQTLAPAMLVACVFDRELNCRRAASAAFQECVGRQGRANFPHGIALLTRADYFAVSSLRHAYLDVSVFVAAYAEYRYELLAHLVSAKLGHWDVQIRTLAAAALGRIARLDTTFATGKLLPQLLRVAVDADVDVASRHGATLAVADVVLALALVPVQLDGELQRALKQLPLDVEKRRLFRGRGGELIRTAVCYVIEVVASAGLALSFAVVKKYVSVLEDCIIHPVAPVRTAAVAAFAAFTMQYCPRILARGAPAHVQYLHALVPRYLHAGVLVPGTSGTSASIGTKTETNADTNKAVLNPNVAARRGFIRAVGAAAAVLLQPCIDECLDTLVRAALIEQQSADELDAESRAAAVQALVDLSSRAPGDLDLHGREDDVVRTLVQCIRADYGVDERGDVGSWVRKDAILGLETLLLGASSYDDVRLRALAGRAVRTAYGNGTIVRVVAVPRRREHEPADAYAAATADPLCIVQFDKPTLGFYYFPPHGRGFLHLSTMRVDTTAVDDVSPAGFELPSLANRVAFAEQHALVKPSVVATTPESFASRVSAHLIGELFCELGKQLAEKLDGLRVAAGRALFALLHATAPRVPAIPDRDALATRIFPATLRVNWSMAHDTFPLVAQLLSCNAYTESVASGLVLSVGGLTESVVKASKAALFDWLRHHTQQRDFGLLTRFAGFLVTLLVRHAQDDRVTLPLLKTLALLLEANLLAFAFVSTPSVDSAAAGSDVSAPTPTPSDFGDRLYTALRDEVQRTTSVPKIAAAVAVLAGLLPSERATERRAFKALVLFLGHRFPKVRKLTAERLYTRLLVHEEVIDDAKYDAVVEILSETAWDGAITVVRDARNELLDLLDMERPAKKQRSEAETSMTSAARSGDSESYGALVKEMGY